ncbi:MAG TPA: hypothetical protein VFC19_13905, partial [Candidatus Limnocylindrales bacterium]|nr:hypothetical protein [Candidatus Limnocylindrales bacterium]
MATIPVTRRHDLTDAQWAALEPLLPTGKNSSTTAGSSSTLNSGTEPPLTTADTQKPDQPQRLSGTPGHGPAHPKA